MLVHPYLVLILCFLLLHLLAVEMVDMQNIHQIGMVEMVDQVVAHNTQEPQEAETLQPHLPRKVIMVELLEQQEIMAEAVEAEHRQLVATEHQQPEVLVATELHRQSPGLR